MYIEIEGRPIKPLTEPTLRMSPSFWLAVQGESRLSALHQVVASSLSSVDVKNLPGHKLRAVQVEHRVYNVGHLSHPPYWMERRQCLMRLQRVHRRLDYSR